MEIGSYTVKEGVWIETYTGKYVNPTDLKIEDINIIDIAHSLSLICRYNGHCSRFYSVAEHSILVMEYVKKRSSNKVDLLGALLHDASEAYFSDVTRPVKIYLTEVKILERKIEKVIIEKFHLEDMNYALIKDADNSILSLEASNLMSSKGKDWYLPVKSEGKFPELVIRPERVESIFLQKYLSITR
jgi:hypothetical protein